LTPPQIHKLFERRISDWSFENWTSNLRKDAGYLPFTEGEKMFADFTYLDSSGYMKDILSAAGTKLREGWSRSTTYHLEIKTTLEGCKEPFFVSQNQLNMVSL
jgi:hypothetical protein